MSMNTIKPALTASDLPSVATVLRDAATYVRINGYFHPWNGDDLYETALPDGSSVGQPAASAEGAITITVYGSPVSTPWPIAFNAEFRLYDQAVTAYLEYLDICHADDEVFYEATTAERVSADLDAAASLWESTHHTPSSPEALRIDEHRRRVEWSSPLAVWGER
jgi:hypothetical protein